MPEMNPKQRLGILTILLLLGAVAFFVMQPRSGAKATLDASFDQASYAAGDEITLTLRLTNAGGGAICVSSMPQGSVTFLSLTRDGEPVATRTTPAYFLAPFDEMLKSGLVPLGAGETAEIALVSEIDEGLVGRALRTTDADAGRGLAMFYDVATPGEYELAVAYEYQGPPSEECGNIFTGATNSATAIFTVTP